MTELIYILVGVLVGAGAAWIILTLRRRSQPDVADALAEKLKGAFADVSEKTLSSAIDNVLKIGESVLSKQTSAGEQTLEKKKELIDARLVEMGSKLKDVAQLIEESKRQRTKTHAELSTKIEAATSVTKRLQETTGQLREALASAKQRGMWGERMAEDVLRLVGLVEGINYHKQRQIAEGTRPDYSFVLPGDRLVHMDVKFPLDNYLRMLEADDDAARESYATQFIRDVRARVKEVTGRGYIDPSQGTVDYMLVFIPIEQVYAFIHERDARLMDDAMKSKVVLCSPFTLYAVLSVIHQGIKNFHVEQSARQIMELLSAFKKEWEKYVDVMDTMGSKLEGATKEYEKLVGVRTRKLEKQLDKIENLQSNRDGDPALPPVSGAADPPSTLG